MYKKYNREKKTLLSNLSLYYGLSEDFDLSGYENIFLDKLATLDLGRYSSVAPNAAFILQNFRRSSFSALPATPKIDKTLQKYMQKISDQTILYKSYAECANEFLPKLNISQICRAISGIKKEMTREKYLKLSDYNNHTRLILHRFRLDEIARHI